MFIVESQDLNCRKFLRYIGKSREGGALHNCRVGEFHQAATTIQLLRDEGKCDIGSLTAGVRLSRLFFLETK